MLTSQPQLKQKIGLTFLAVSLILTPLTVQALEVEEVPNPRQINGTWVTDQANILNSNTETQLNQMISELETKNGTEIAVVTVPETKPSASPKEFTTKLFNYWGIGKKGKNNGVLFLISQGDRRVEIETGYGIEAILPDAKVGNIINTEITARFKQGDFDGGTLAGTNALIVSLGNQEITNTTNSSQNFTTPDNLGQNFDFSWRILGIIGIGFGAIFGINKLWKYIHRPSYLEPQGHSTLKRKNERPVHCSLCKQLMTQIDQNTLENSLKPPEKTAIKIGSLEFEGWQCSNCNPSGFHLRMIILDSKFDDCPQCRGRTLEQTKKTLKDAKYDELLITQNCHHCDYHNQKYEIIPKISRRSSFHSSDYGSSSGGGSDYGSSSGSGSDFGGGDSGGGGGGGDY